MYQFIIIISTKHLRVLLLLTLISRVASIITSGGKIAPNTGANATTFFTLATKS